MTNLQKYREAAGLSIRQLSRYSHVHHGHIARCEKQDRKLGWRAALAISQALKISPVELLHEQ
jgi:transcriptional regulator with XRE-family HTH domain